MRIAALYERSPSSRRSPVVELNRAVVLAMAYGPAAGLEIVDALATEPSLKNYHLLPGVRGDLLARLGRFDEAAAEFERAAALTRNVRERARYFSRGHARLVYNIGGHERTHRRGGHDPPRTSDLPGVGALLVDFYGRAVCEPHQGLSFSAETRNQADGEQR